LTKEDYIELKKRIVIVDDFCKKIISELDSEEEFMQNFLPKIIQYAKHKELYSNISQYLLKARNAKKSVLELMIEEFSFIKEVQI